MSVNYRAAFPSYARSFFLGGGRKEEEEGINSKVKMALLGGGIEASG